MHQPQLSCWRCLMKASIFQLVDLERQAALSGFLAESSGLGPDLRRREHPVPALRQAKRCEATETTSSTRDQNSL